MATPETSDLNSPHGHSEPGENGRLPLEPMDPHLTDIQPGSGVVIHLELAWGYLRRAYLKIFRRGYVARMKELRKRGSEPLPV